MTWDQTDTTESSAAAARRATSARHWPLPAAVPLLLTVAALLWLAAPSVGGAVRAQGATGTPVATACAVPMLSTDPPAASPVATTVPATGAPVVGGSDSDAIQAVARAFASCLTKGNYRTAARLGTANELGALYGGGEPLDATDFLALVKDVPPVSTRIVAIADVKVQGGKSATAIVDSVVGNQLLHERWSFVASSRARQGETGWQVDRQEAMAVDPPDGASSLEVAMEENAFGLIETEARGPDLVLKGRNGGAEDHEMLVVRLRRGTTTGDILRAPGPGLPRGATFVGQVTVPANDRAEMVLVDLDPGTYTIIDLLPAPNGTPHLASGMEIDFQVT